MGPRVQHPGTCLTSGTFGNDSRAPVDSPPKPFGNFCVAETHSVIQSAPTTKCRCTL